MTRKHYISIANVIRAEAETSETTRTVLKPVVEQLCVVFRHDNVAFDPEKFTTACGL